MASELTMVADLQQVYLNYVRKVINSHLFVKSIKNSLQTYCCCEEQPSIKPEEYIRSLSTPHFFSTVGRRFYEKTDNQLLISLAAD